MLSVLVAPLLLAQMPLMSLKRDVVSMDGATTFALAPPICVYSPTALTYEWSPSGKHVLVHGIVLESFSPVAEAKGKMRIEVIEWRTGKRELIGESSGELNMIMAQWATSDSLLISEAILIPSGPTRAEPGSRSSLSLRRLGSPNITKLYEVEHEEPHLITPPNAMVSKQGYALITIEDRQFVKYEHLNFKTLKKSPAAPQGRLREDAQGLLVYDEFKDRRPTGNMVRYLPDGKTETLPATPPPKEAAEPLQLVPSSAQMKLGKKTEAVAGLWMMATHPSDYQFALVSGSADVQSARIAPDRSAVAYMDKGNVFVREMIKLGTVEFTALLDREEQQEALSKAKQLATAMHIYAADWDDVFPTPDGFKDKLMPYVKNGQLFDGFVYTFPGGKATDIAEPSKTEVGYVQGRRGRAVAYADGHVKWIKNP